MKPSNEYDYSKTMSFYCKECGKCKDSIETDKNLKVTHNTGWTHDIFCQKLNKTAVYRRNNAHNKERKRRFN